MGKLFKCLKRTSGLPCLLTRITHFLGRLSFCALTVTLGLYMHVNGHALCMHVNPCKNLTEISARSRQSRRDWRDLGEIATISARFQNIAPRKVTRGEIAAISPRSRQDRRDLGEITTISARLRNIASRYLPRGEIVMRSHRTKPVRGEITAISARFQNIAPRYPARSEITTRSRRDIVTISARIAAISAISCRDFYCCDAGTVSIFARFIS